MPTAREALNLADRLPDLRWAKIGPVLYVREGPALVREFIGRGVRVFLDLKWHDIPYTVAGAVAAARDVGVSLATVHCLGGRAMLDAAVAMRAIASGRRDRRRRTMRPPSSTFSDAGTRPRRRVERLARVAVEAGLRAWSLRARSSVCFARCSGPTLDCGSGDSVAGENAGDQARTITPADAVRLGATHLVVGRPITADGNPLRHTDRS